MNKKVKKIPKKGVLQQSRSRLDTALGRMDETSEGVSEEIIDVVESSEAMASVGVEYALTMNLGNYENAKIGVSINIPCIPSKVDSTYEEASAWVESRITKERDKIWKAISESRERQF